MRHLTGVKSNDSSFTFKEAYEVQISDICRWAKVLTTEAYLKLLQQVMERNSKGYNSPYDVCRGTDISTIVANLSN